MSAVATLALLQAVSGPVLPLPPRPRSDAPCPIVNTADVVVCARPGDAYRLRPLPDRAEEPAIPKAEVRIGNTALAAETEQATLAGGQQSKRLMLRWKVPLGGKR